MNFSIIEDLSKSIVTPIKVEHLCLSVYAFRVYGHLANPTKKYPKHIKGIAKHIGVAVSTTRDAVKELLQKELVEEFTYSNEDALAIILAKTPQVIGGFDLHCEWCNGITACLQEHHYPVRKSAGGAEIVNICPSCHYEFHFLTDTTFVRLMG